MCKMAQVACQFFYLCHLLPETCQILTNGNPEFCKKNRTHVIGFILGSFCKKLENWQNLLNFNQIVQHTDSDVTFERTVHSEHTAVSARRQCSWQNTLDTPPDLHTLHTESSCSATHSRRQCPATLHRKWHTQCTTCTSMHPEEPRQVADQGSKCGS